MVWTGTLLRVSDCAAIMTTSPAYNYEAHAIYAGRTIFMLSASRTAACVLSAIFDSNCSRAALTSAGGPASSNSRGGGLSNNKSPMQVARENITYKCNHQSASLVPLCPCGSILAQSIVTPVRMVCSCDAVEVRKYACVSAKPVRLTVCVSELLQVNSVSTGAKSRRPFAHFVRSTLLSSSGPVKKGINSSQTGEPSKSSSWSQTPKSNNGSHMCKKDSIRIFACLDFGFLSRVIILGALMLDHRC